MSHLILAMLTACGYAAAPTRVEVIADNSIVIYKGEEHLNTGGNSRIRIKGNQHLVALKIDPKPLKGKIVRSATLVCHRADRMIEGVTISTIAAPWDERRSCALTAGPGETDGWGWPGARFSSVTGSNSFTLVSQAKSQVKDGAYHWQLDPDLVHANAIGAAQGLAIHEMAGDYSRNPTIWSREQSGKCPHLLVTFGGKDGKPSPATGLELTPAQMSDFIGRYVSLDGRVVTRYAEDAGTAQYDRLSPDALRRLREAAAALLEREA